MPSVSSTASCRNAGSLVPSDGVCPMSLTTQIWMPPCYSWRSTSLLPSWHLDFLAKCAQFSYWIWNGKFENGPPKPFPRLRAWPLHGNVEGRSSRSKIIFLNSEVSGKLHTKPMGKTCSNPTISSTIEVHHCFEQVKICHSPFLLHPNLFWLLFSVCSSFLGTPIPPKNWRVPAFFCLGSPHPRWLAIFKLR